MVYGITVRDDVLSGAPQRRLIEFAAARDAPAVDLLPVFRAGQGALFLRNRAITYDPVHPSPEGHRLLGMAVQKLVLGSRLARPHTNTGAGALSASARVAPSRGGQNAPGLGSTNSDRARPDRAELPRWMNSHQRRFSSPPASLLPDR